jgi:dsDNA-specific endonuclease/ATPase MutS2
MAAYPGRQRKGKGHLRKEVRNFLSSRPAVTTMRFKI